MHHRSAEDVLEHCALRGVHVRVDALGKDRRDVHVLVVDVLRTPVSGYPATGLRIRSKLSPLTITCDAVVLVAVTPQTLELEVVFAFVIGFGDDGFGDSALTGLGLVFGHDLLLRCTEGLSGVTLIVVLPLIETTRDLILDVRAADLHVRNGDIAVTLLIMVDEERITEGTALVIVDTPAHSALADLFFTGGGLVLWEVQPVLFAFVVGDVVVLGKLDSDRTVPRTEVTVTLATEHRVTFNKRKLEVLRVRVVSPNAKLLTSSRFPLVDSAQRIGPVRQADGVRAVRLCLRGVDRRYGATLLLVVVVNPLSVDLDTSKRLVNSLLRSNVGVAVQEDPTVNGLLSQPVPWRVDWPLRSKSRCRSLSQLVDSGLGHLSSGSLVHTTRQEARRQRRSQR